VAESLLDPLPFSLASVPVREFYPLPDYVEVSIGPRQAQLCLFWSQAEGDALALLAGLRIAERPILVRHVKAAIALLETLPHEGVARLAKALGRRIVTASRDVPWYYEVPGVELRNGSYTCAGRSGGGVMACNAGARFKIAGVRGTFCEVHLRHKLAVRRVALRQKSA